MLTGKVFMAVFDAKMKTYTDKRNYRLFARALRREGFLYVQHSVYARHMEGSRSLAVQAERIRRFTPSSIRVYVFALPVAVFLKTAAVNCELPEIVKTCDIICI